MKRFRKSCINAIDILAYHVRQSMIKSCIFDSIEDNKTEESGDPELDKIYNKYLGNNDNKKTIKRDDDGEDDHKNDDVQVVPKKSKSLDADFFRADSESAYFEEDGSRKGR